MLITSVIKKNCNLL